ncbi:hypothetical protein L1987_49214 [Smallanthus sonchifolius]|uniref:Uncharacterized protein n=1 Tax=Smallanthus sonchifolius TaxID=185202 RepID=A0ACB9FUZ6_9ASTR|nr:hypothetical protein L1987_49214 [Smallanthus sonchifolius]
MALLSDAIYKSVKENCNGEYLEVDPNNSLCIRDLQVVDKDDNYLYSYIWANKRDVREALHVREEFSDIEWVRCNDSLRFNSTSYTQNVLTSVGYHRRLADKHCRALIYR